MKEPLKVQKGDSAWESQEHNVSLCGDQGRVGVEDTSKKPMKVNVQIESLCANRTFFY